MLYKAIVGICLAATSVAASFHVWAQDTAAALAKEKKTLCHQGDDVVASYVQGATARYEWNKDKLYQSTHDLKIIIGKEIHFPVTAWLLSPTQEQNFDALLVQLAHYSKLLRQSINPLSRGLRGHETGYCRLFCDKLDTVTTVEDSFKLLSQFDKLDMNSTKISAGSFREFDTQRWHEFLQGPWAALLHFWIRARNYPLISAYA
jgi:hypothetical protein